MEFRPSAPDEPPPPPLPPPSPPQIWLQRRRCELAGIDFHHHSPPLPPPPPQFWLQRLLPPGCNDNLEMSNVNPEIKREVDKKAEGINALSFPAVSLKSKVKEVKRVWRRKQTSLLSAESSAGISVTKRETISPAKGGKVDQASLSTKCLDGNGKSVFPEKKNKSKSKEKKDYAFWCEMCKIGADQEYVMEAHVKGKKHLKLVPKETANKDQASLVIVKKTNSFPVFREVILSIFDKAVEEPTDCPMYAQLFSHLIENLPPLPSDDPGGKEITVKQVLADICQEAFEGVVKYREELRQKIAHEENLEHRNKNGILKLRNLGIICLIGELFNQRILSETIVHNIIQELLNNSRESCPFAPSVEALSQFFSTIGKQLAENQNSRINDLCINFLEDKSNWIPKQQEGTGGLIKSGAPSVRSPHVHRTCGCRRNHLPDDLVVAAFCIFCLVIVLHRVFF